MRNRLVFAVVLGLILLAAAVPQFGTAHADEESAQIYLQGATFDPVTGRAPIADLVPGNANNLYLVQFTGPVLEAWKAEVTSLGAKLYGYIPEHAFIARMDERTAAAVGELRSVRWVGDYEAAYRLDPALTGTRAAAGAISLNVQTLPDADLSALTRQITQLGGTVTKQDRNSFAGYLDVTLPSERVGELAAQDSVIWVEPDIAPELSNRVGGGQIMRTNSVRASLGLFGAGQVVAIADTGLDTGDANNLHADLSGRLIQAYCLGRPNPCNWNDTDGHGTHVAGSVLGSGFRSGSSPAAHFYSNSEAGTAPEAQYVFQSLLDPNGGLGGIPADDGQLMRQAYQHGARIHTNSWGANVNGVYTSDSQAVDQAAWELKDMLILFAAGNHGQDANPRNGVVDADSLGAPGTAKNILSVGASENFYPNGVPAMCPSCPGGLGTFNPTWGDERFPMFPIWGDGGANNAYGMAPFSSRGPTDDGRIKPDIVAPGAWILSTLSRAADTTGWAPYNDHYYWLGGTSMATPLTAGGATLVREWLTRIQGVANPSAALMKALLLNGATDMAPGQYGFTQHQEVPWSRPNNVAGWGRADMVNTVAPPAPRRIWFTDPSNGLGTGDVAEYQVTLTGPAYRGAEGEEAIPEGATGSVTLAGPDSSDLGFDLDSEPVQAEEGASAPQGAQETRATNAQILQNTSFEFDTVWQTHSPNNVLFVTEQAYSGARSMASFSNPNMNSANSDFYQTVTIPADATQVSVSYQWKTANVGAFDFIQFDIWDQNFQTKIATGPAHEDSFGQWKSELLYFPEAAVNAIRGRTVNIRFFGSWQFLQPETVFYIDDMALSVNAGPIDADSARFMLAWTDYPGQPAAARQLVNDLDLEVIAPNGTTYRGNQGAYPGGHPCVSNGADRCNNTEGVVIPNAQAGTYRLLVRGVQVPQSRQPFALAATGNNAQGTVVTPPPAPQPAASISPTSLSFGSHNVGTTSTAQAVTLSNTGSATLNISSIATSGDFAQTNNCGSTLAAGANCTINVTFSPTAAGSRTGSLAVASNAPGSAHSIPLAGTGVAVNNTPAVSLSPTSLTFASQNVGTTSAAKPVTLSNTGTGALSITSIATTGNFAQTNNCGTSLAAGANCTINVTFSPTAGGTRTGNLTVTSNAAGSPHTVSLSGTSPVVSFNPTSLTFGSQAVGSTSTAQPVTFRNHGTTAISIAVGTGGDFAQTNNCGTTLAAGANCTINVTFTPTVAGSRTGSLSVASNAPGSPHSIPLSGTGVTLTTRPQTDFNGDGKADILWRNASTGQNSIYQMNGKTVVSNTAITRLTDLNYKVAGVGDFTGDGKADILWRHHGTGYNYLWTMNGAAVVSSQTINRVSDLNWKVAGVADFNADGKADILWRHATTGQNSIYLMNGKTVVSNTAITRLTDLNYTVAGLADFTGDGKADVLWRHIGTGYNYLWTMNGTAVAASATINRVSDLNMKVAGVGDFNADGKADILWRNASTGQNSIYLMNGKTIISNTAIVRLSDLNYKVAGVGDFTGDGKADILWRHHGTGYNYLYTMNGTTVASSATINRVSDLNMKVVGFGVSPDYYNWNRLAASEEAENALMAASAGDAEPQLVEPESLEGAPYEESDAAMVLDVPADAAPEVALPGTLPEDAYTPDEQEPTSVTLADFESQPTSGTWAVLAPFALLGLLGAGLLLRRRTR